MTSRSWGTSRWICLENSLRKWRGSTRSCIERPIAASEATRSESAVGSGDASGMAFLDDKPRAP